MHLVLWCVPGLLRSGPPRRSLSIQYCVDRELSNLLSFLHERPRESFDRQRLLPPLFQGWLGDGFYGEGEVVSPLINRGYFRLCFKGGCLGVFAASEKSSAL